MEFHLGARVRRNNGEHLGELTRVVYDPQSLSVEFVVVQSVRLGERELSVPVEAIENTDAEQVHINLTHDEFESLDVYSSSHNVAPPPDRDYADLDEADELAPGTEVPPVGAATGIESIAFVPIVQEDVYIPTGDGVIDRATEVWATDGLVGTVRSILTEDHDSRVSELVVRHGTVFSHDVSVPATAIESTRSGNIVLSVERSAVDAEESDRG